MIISKEGVLATLKENSYDETSNGSITHLNVGNQTFDHIHVQAST